MIGKLRIFHWQGATVKGEIIMMHLSGNTSLHWTSRKGHESVVRALVELGADVHAKDNE